MVARRDNVRGASALGCLFSIMILMVLLYYGIDAGRAYWSFYRFQDEMETSARFAQTQSDDQIRQHLRGVALDLGLPAEAQKVTIRRVEHPPTVTIRSQYTIVLELPFTHKRITLKPVAEVRQ